MNGADYLALVLAELLQRKQLSSLTREWLVKNLLVYLQAGGFLSIEEALGLTGSGRRGVHRQLATAMRNIHLQEAAAQISLDATLSQWARCERLAEQAKRLIPVLQRQFGEAERPPTEWDSWKKSLFHAWRTGVQIPCTARGLHRLLNATPHCSVQQEGIKVVACYTSPRVKNDR